jgi:hypothetical protein
MKKILMTLLMLAPMTVAAEGERIIMRGQSPQEYLEHMQQAEAQQTTSPDPLMNAPMDEVTKRRVSRARDAFVRNVYVGYFVVNEVAREVAERLKAEGRGMAYVSDIHDAIVVAGYQMGIDSARPYISDMKGFKVVAVPVGNFTYFPVRREDAPTLDGERDLFIKTEIARFEDEIEEIKARMSVKRDENMPEVQGALEEIKRRLPPKGKFALE